MTRKTPGEPLARSGEKGSSARFVIFDSDGDGKIMHVPTGTMGEHASTGSHQSERIFLPLLDVSACLHALAAGSHDRRATGDGRRPRPHTASRSTEGHRRSGDDDGNPRCLVENMKQPCALSLNHHCSYFLWGTRYSSFCALSRPVICPRLPRLIQASLIFCCPFLPRWQTAACVDRPIPHRA